MLTPPERRVEFILQVTAVALSLGMLEIIRGQVNLIFNIISSNNSLLIKKWLSYYDHR